MWLWLYAWIVPCLGAYVFLCWIRRWIRINNITKKHVLITGCDLGVGHLLAQRLDMIGFRVFAACVSESGKTRLLQVTSHRVRTLTLDVTKADDTRTAFDFVRANIPENEELWAVVNNADTFGHIIGPIEWHTADDFREVMEVNLMGMVRVTSTFLPLLKTSRGRIINMSSVGGRLPSSLCLPYCVSKAAVESLSDGLRQHLMQYHVTVHVIEPSLFRTDAAERQPLRRAAELGWKETTWQIKNEFGEDYFQNLCKYATDLSSLTAKDTPRAIKAYVHALTARCPCTRYSVGWSATFWEIPLTYAPSFVTDSQAGRLISKLVPASLKADFEEGTIQLGTLKEK